MDYVGQDETKIEKNNACLIAIFLFQYSLLIPLMLFIDSKIVVGAFTVLIVLISLFINKRIYFNTKNLVLLLIILVLIGIKILIYQENGVNVLVSFIAVGVPSLYIVSQHFSKMEFLKICYKLAIINFLLIFWVPVTRVNINYMRFGYGMAPTTVFLYCYIKHEKDISTGKKVASILLLLMSVLEIILFGARGSLLPIIIFVAIDITLLNKINLKLVTPFALGMIVYINAENIVNYVINNLGRFGFRSYALRKIRMQLTKGFEDASSGRYARYSAAIDRIKQNLFWGSDMIGGLSDDYTHNYFLQITEEFGIFALILSVLFLLYCIFCMGSKRITREKKLILAIFFSLSMGRLLFSSSYWLRPEFWLFVGFELTSTGFIRLRLKT